MGHANQDSTALGYYCAGRHCAKKEKCHRYVSSTKINNATYDQYDRKLLRDGICIYFVNITAVPY